MPPLSRSQFEAGDADPALAALDFLKGNPDLAFTLDELVEALEEVVGNVSSTRLKAGLRRMVSKGQAETRTVGRVVYYRYRRRDVGFRR
jgi:hypothetical protein